VNKKKIPAMLGTALFQPFPRIPPLPMAQANKHRTDIHAVAWRGGGVQLPPHPKFRRPSKIVPNSIRLWKLLKISEFRTPAHKDFRKKGSKILKLPPVRNCFTLAMANKLVIINSLKVPKIKKILLCEMKVLVTNYSCFQNPWLGGCRPQIPVLSVLCPQLNLLNRPPPRTKFPGTPMVS